MHEHINIKKIVESLGNNPEKIFRHLNLPIHYINDVKSFGKGRLGRKLIYLNREVYSPEIVAVIHLEEQGVAANWSEGLALEIVFDAIKKVISDFATSMFECGDTKQILINQATERQKSKIDCYMTDIPELTSMEYEDAYALLQARGLVSSDSPLSQLEKSISNEKVIFSEKGILGCISLSFLVLYPPEQLDWRLSLSPSLKALLPSAEIQKKVHDFIVSIGSNSELIKSAIVLPEKNNDKTDPRNKFKTDWTLNFAKKIIEECDLMYLAVELSGYTSQLPRWDLTAIDLISRKLRYIEVKVEDNFTQWQLNRMPSDLESGCQIELIIVNMSKQ